MAKLEVLYDRLDDLLMCPVCLEIPHSKVSQCVNGHHICNFCKTKVPQCPVCAGRFIGTRNIAVENLNCLLEELKVSVKHEINSIEEKLLKDFAEHKRGMLEGESKTISTQTDFRMVQTLVCVSTQTNKENFTSSVKMVKKNTAVVSVASYPCLLGSCLLELPYEDLVKHLIVCHKDTFYQVERCRKFTEKCIIETDRLPKSYHFAFHISNMGLFFFKVTIESNRELLASVQVADDCISAKKFEYELAIGNRHRLIRRSRPVTSCQTNKGSLFTQNLHIIREEMDRMIMGKSVECTLTIRRHFSIKREF